MDTGFSIVVNMFTNMYTFTDRKRTHTSIGRYAISGKLSAGLFNGG
jgi:hypothetical protein